MPNNVTYSIELTPENAEKIDRINRILLGDSYTESVAESAAADRARQVHREEAQLDKKSADNFKSFVSQASEGVGQAVFVPKGKGEALLMKKGGGFETISDSLERLIDPELRDAMGGKPNDATESKAVETETTTTAEPEATENEEVAPTTEPTPTLIDLKKVAKKAKNDHGALFCNDVLVSHGVKLVSTLPKSLAKVPADKIVDVMAALETGPKLDTAIKANVATEKQVTTDVEFNDPVESRFTDVPDGELKYSGEGKSAPSVEPAPSVESVKAALIAFCKINTREDVKKIMKKHGATKLTDVGKCDDDQLRAMFKDAMVVKS